MNFRQIQFSETQRAVEEMGLRCPGPWSCSSVHCTLIAARKRGWVRSLEEEDWKPLLDHAFLHFVNLLVVFNPPGIVPQYLYFTRHVPPEAKTRLALRCVLIATTVLVAFIVLGQLLLEALGIGFPAFSIAGGIILLVISLRMILESV